MTTNCGYCKLKKTWLLLVVGTLLTASNTFSAVVAAPRLFHDSLQPVLVELPPVAIPLWRSAGAAVKPTLILFSNDPLLQPVPAALAAQAKTLAMHATAPEIARSATILTANPQLLPAQTVSAALEAGLLSELYWILPPLKSGSKPDLKTFTGQLLDTGIATTEEVNSFVAIDDGFRGKIRGLPVTARFFSRQLDIKSDGPLLVHFDLSFFLGIYSDEVKTPILPLLSGFSETVRTFNWAPKAITISYAPGEGQIPLNFRFVGNLLAQLLRTPGMRKSGWPQEWQQFGQALYLATFMNTDEPPPIYRKLCQKDPQNADFQYALYRSLRPLKQAKEAFAALDRAVAINPAYGVEFQALSQSAEEASQHFAALEMTERAAKIFPDNPFIKIRQVELLIASNHANLALPILDQLERLPWSPTYNPEAGPALGALRARAVATPKQEPGPSR